MNQTEWVVRPAEAGDIEAMLSLWSEIPEVKSSIPDSREAVQHFMACNQSSFLVAVAGGRLVGTIMGAYNGWRGSIYHMAVALAFRGQGIGRALMERCLNALRKRGAPRVDLYTFADNYSAHAFYERLGWRERSEIKNYSWDYPLDS